jgi:hypothetical protein
MEDLKLSISRNLKERQIQILTREDIIHWGPQGSGEFKAQTTYQLLQDSAVSKTDPFGAKFGATPSGPKSLLSYG